mmetsp:Transcript_21656/g.30293  ORF Transcript_21656/g.30293 Transcript_21656/m.30293 type:complete len:228 (-) Transcript_21656:52-735(-)
MSLHYGTAKSPPSGEVDFGGKESIVSTFPTLAVNHSTVNNNNVWISYSLAVDINKKISKDKKWRVVWKQPSSKRSRDQSPAIITFPAPSLSNNANSGRNEQESSEQQLVERMAKLELRQNTLENKTEARLSDLECEICQPSTPPFSPSNFIGTPPSPSRSPILDNNMDNLASKILEALADGSPLRTLQITKKVGKTTTNEVNPSLYRLKDQGKVIQIQQQPPTWKLA